MYITGSITQIATNKSKGANCASISGVVTDKHLDDGMAMGNINYYSSQLR